MSLSKKQPSAWQRSPSVGITPITVGARYGKQTVKKTDLVLTGSNKQKLVEPVLGERDGASAAFWAKGSLSGVSRVCSVCSTHTAEYSCPRCLIAYCSSKCYKVRTLCTPYTVFLLSGLHYYATVL